MAPKILVIDRNEAFATMLEQMLSIDGGYDVQVTHAADDALALLQQTAFDLTILDMDLGPGGMDYQDLIQTVREIRPTMRLMLIPLMGQDLNQDASQLNIQGTLAKPFFADDLLPSIQDALAKPVGPVATAPAPKQEPKPKPASLAPKLPVAESSPNVQSVLLELARETRADTILLLSVVSDAVRVIAHASALDAEGASTLAGLIVDMIQASQAVRRFLKQLDTPFEHSMFEGGDLCLYVMAVTPEILLVAVTPTSTPLGTIRHNMRRAGRSLDGVALT